LTVEHKEEIQNIKTTNEKNTNKIIDDYEKRLRECEHKMEKLI